jgi:ATP-dependent helicase/nuclease subunit B
MAGELKITGGRTRRLWPVLISELDIAYRKGTHCIVIVPEHYTLRSERDILAGLGIPGYFEIEVLSPSRLSHRVFELAGTDGRIQIDKRGQFIALARALSECKRKLHYYIQIAEKSGFVERAGKLIADLKISAISPEYLAEQADAIEDELLKEKLKDISIIFSTYEKQLKGRFVDGEDVLEMMVERIAPSRIADESAVFVYGFDLLTNDFRRMLFEISKYACYTNVYLVMDKESVPDGDCFETIRDSASKLLDMVNANVKQGSLAWLEHALLNAPPEIRHLEQVQMLSLPKAYTELPDSIRLYAAPTPYAEAHFVAQQIVVERKRGVAYEDICIVFGDLPRYEGIASAVLEAYGIPVYIARKRSLMSSGAVRFLLVALRAAAGSYRQEDVMAAIKSGFSPLNESECWQLENYAIAWGIKGKSWLDPFVRGADIERGAAEQARQKLITPLEKLHKTMRDAKNADESITAVYNLLEDVSAYSRLVEQISSLTDSGYESQAIIVRQVWDLIMSLLDQLHELMQGSRVPARYAATWLEAGMRASEISALPPTKDCILCAAIGNIVFSEPQVLFVMGMNDGIQAVSQNGLLGDVEINEAELVTGTRITLGSDNHEALARLELWKTLSAPQSRLYISYSLAMQEGTVLRPAKEISHMKRIFPQLAEEGGANAAAGAMFPLAPVPALDVIAVKLRLHTLYGDWAEAWKWLNTDPAWQHHAQALTAALHPVLPEVPISRKLTGSLFSDKTISVSRLERFACCPYSHFVNHGLKPRPRVQWELNPINTGEFYHAAMETFTRFLPAVKEWPNITRKACDDLMDTALRPIREKWKDGPMGDSARMYSEGKRYINVCKRVAWTFTRGAQRSSFRPSDAEVRFGFDDGGLPPLLLDLPDGNSVYVRGIIDRIDRYEGDSGLYLRIVDYKSGDQSPSAEQIWWGIHLQLLIYLEAALQAVPGAEPAGAFYQHMADPFVSCTAEDIGEEGIDKAAENLCAEIMTDAKTISAVENRIAHALRLNGIALRDAEILKLMDGYDPPLTLSPMLKKNGEAAKNKPLLPLDQLKSLITHAHRKAAKITALIRSGEIAVHPVSVSPGKSECDHCEFEGVCRKDPMTGYGREWPIAAMNYDELMEKIAETEAAEK